MFINLEPMRNAMENRVIDSKHNNPPSDAEILFENLRERNKDLLDRAAKLFEAEGRLPQVSDDETAGKVTDFIKMVNNCNKLVDGARVTEKEPFLRGGKTVDEFFKIFSTGLTGLAARAKGNLDSFMQRKHLEEQKRLKEEADRKRQEAEALAAIAAQTAAVSQELGDIALDNAIQTENAANIIDMQANAKSGLVTPMRSESGASASMRVSWVVEIDSLNDVDLESLRLYLSPDDVLKAARAYVRAGGRDLKGARIYQKTETVVR
jgi:DNA-binding protein H-NS